MLRYYANYVCYKSRISTKKRNSKGCSFFIPKRGFRTTKAVPLLCNVNPFGCTRLTFGNNRCKANPRISTIFVVRKSYNTQKAQDIAYLVLFCYYILCFCRWTKSLNLTAAFRRFFQKTGLELTTYRFCSIGYYNFIIIFRENKFLGSLFFVAV